MMHWYDAAMRIAQNSPAGPLDPAALDKFHAEVAELRAATTLLDAVQEAADCVYYPVKAVHTGLISLEQATVLIRSVLDEAGISLADATTAMVAKYAVRQHLRRKDHAAETAAVSAALGWGA